MKVIKVSEATGPALDWLVARAEGKRPSMFIFQRTGSLAKEHNYSTDWAQGGPIIEREAICLKHGKYIETSAYIYSGDGYAAYVQGPTALISAMRAHVYRKLGPTAEVPDELI